MTKASEIVEKLGIRSKFTGFSDANPAALLGPAKNLMTGKDSDLAYSLTVSTDEALQEAVAQSLADETDPSGELKVAAGAIAAGLKQSVSKRISGEKVEEVSQEKRHEDIRRELPSAMYIDGKLYGPPKG